MAKITKQEFKNYSEQFLSIFVRMMNTPEFQNESEEEKEKSKVKEHIIARGYYTPSSPLSLIEYRERINKRG